MNDSKLQWESVIQLGVALFGGLLFSGALATLVMLTCGIGVVETATIVVAEPNKVGIGDYEELMATLRGAGGIVREAGEFTQPFFRAGARVVYVEDAQLLVFEYPNERDREAESALISVDGNSVGCTQITWTDQPNFWAAGRVIVEYLGRDQTVLSLLCDALGTPITMHGQLSASRKD